jgi:hypothetical protein
MSLPTSSNEGVTFGWNFNSVFMDLYMIQVDIGGHPPIPTSSKHFFGNLLFLVVYRDINFWGQFEGLNDDFSLSDTSKISKGYY